MKAALSLIGFVDNESEGRSCAAQLKLGQSIVSKDGAYWRWDGLHIKSNASDRHALFLQQTNRLKELEDMLPQAQQSASQARDTFQSAKEVKTVQQNSFDEAQSNLRQEEQLLSSTQNQLNTLIEERSGLFAGVAKYEEALANIQKDIEETLSLIHI